MVKPEKQTPGEQNPACHQTSRKFRGAQGLLSSPTALQPDRRNQDVVSGTARQMPRLLSVMATVVLGSHVSAKTVMSVFNVTVDMSGGLSR